MKISEIEQQNIDAWKQFCSNRNIELSDIELKRLDRAKGILFKISQEQFKDFLDNNFDLILRQNKKIQKNEIVKKTLDNLKQYIDLNQVEFLKEQIVQRMQIENSEDEDFQDDIDNFDVKQWLQVKKEVPGQQKYIKNEIIELVNCYPKNYPNLNLSFNREGELQANIQRYTNFYQKFKKYLDKTQNFKLEIKETPTQSITMICRVIFGEPTNDEQSKYFLEYRVSDGFEYIIPEFNTLDDYLIYPGQMLLIQGVFFMRKFQIQSIINTDTFSNIYLKKIELPPLQKQCKIMFIKGPFYLKNYTFEDLFSSLKGILKEYFCNLLVIQGPIVSFKRKGKPDEYTYQQIKEDFLKQLSTSLSQQKIIYIEDEMEISLLENIPIPAMNQNKFDKDLKKIITMPSPCILQIGHVNIAICANKLYDDFMRISLHKTSVQETKQQSIFRTIIESQNLHPIFVPGDQTQYSLINEMNYDFPIDMFLLSTQKEESFAQKLDDMNLVNLDRLYQVNKDYIQ